MSLKRFGNSDAPSIVFQIDDLTYTYKSTNSNQLINITEGINGNKDEGFKDGNPTTDDDYDYDANGNMTIDRNKGITAITYNQLNLPTKITFGTAGNITYIYNALGQKAQKVVNATGVSAVTTDYLGGYQYKNAVLQFFPTAEGYVSVTGSSYKYVYNYTDHLGNIRLSYAKNPTTNVLEILEENNYYPFGMKHSLYNTDNFQPNYKYKYNGKELQDENIGGNQLNLYDYGARNYDPAIGRWMNVDPLAEHPKQIDKTPYGYAWDNPVRLNDPDGKCPDCPDGVYLALADHSYSAKRGDISPNGWQAIRVDQNDKTGFKGVLYQGYNGTNEKQYIYSTAGTQDLMKDGIQNIKQLEGTSQQYKQSTEIAKQLSIDFEGKVSYGGHSLGGGLASANALATNGKAVTFNAAGLSSSTKDNLGLTGKTANISAYVVAGEAVSYSQSLLGLKAEGNITTLPASYAPKIPYTSIDDIYRTYQRVENHTMGVVTEKFNERK